MLIQCKHALRHALPEAIRLSLRRCNRGIVSQNGTSVCAGLGRLLPLFRIWLCGAMAVWYGMTAWHGITVRYGMAAAACDGVRFPCAASVQGAMGSWMAWRAGWFPGLSCGPVPCCGCGSARQVAEHVLRLRPTFNTLSERWKHQHRHVGPRRTA